MKRCKAAILFVAVVVAVCGWSRAQGISDFEALLEDIGGQPSETLPAKPAEGTGVTTEGTESRMGAPSAVAEPVVEAEEELATEEIEEQQPRLLAEPVEEEIAPAPDLEAIEALEPVSAREEETTTEELMAPAEPSSDELVAPEYAPAPETAEPLVETTAEESVETPLAMEDAEPVADEKPLPTLPPEPTAEKKKVALLAAQQEEVRRQAMEAQGEKSLEEGFRLLMAGDYAGASKQFEEALKNLIDRPKNAEARTKAKWGWAEAEYRLAAELYRRKERLSEARTSCEKVLKLSPEHKGAAALLAKIERLEQIMAQPVPPKSRPDVLKKRQRSEDLLKEGKQYFDLGEYDRAELLFEKVLVEDRYNTDAMRFLKKIEERRAKTGRIEREATAAAMLRKVQDAWNPPVREEVVLPEDVVRGAIVQQKTPAQRLQEKMARIIIPFIEFRQANIVDVVNFLVEESRAGDEEGTGVNIILNLNLSGQEGGAPEPAAALPSEFGGGEDIFGPAPAPVTEAVPSPTLQTITLNLRRISLLDAVKYITEVAGLKFRVEDNAVIITPAGVVSGRVVTRMYPVQPSILDVIIERGAERKERTGEFIEMGGAATTIRKGDVKEFFEKAGVPFPAGTSITYNQAISQLIVANTPENLEIFERILANLNVVPNQVEIEARFVEIGQRDLEELGLQWILTDNWEVATKKGTGPIAGRERIDVLADQQGVTKGLRFFAFDNTTAIIDPASAVTRTVNQVPLGGILSVASVLTNPEMKIILQALSQRGSADLLSAPRITTRSGVNASIAVVREIIYPTDFEVTEPTIQSEGNLVTPPTVTPHSFQTREVGVILNVTPTVGPDGYTIDLTLVPEVAELVDWIQYGSEISIGQPIQNPLTGLIVGSRENNFRYNIPQPVFSTRKATTSVVIWDGQTVVMGGLIREELTTFKDKIPLLGDIPVLGRLFRSEGQKSSKKNLLIFVTARLVDPSGKPIHKAEAVAATGTPAAPVATP